MLTALLFAAAYYLFLCWSPDEARCEADAPWETHPAAGTRGQPKLKGQTNEPLETTRRLAG